jgi:Acyl-CoA dehydrogenase, middle domain
MTSFGPLSARESRRPWGNGLRRDAFLWSSSGSWGGWVFSGCTCTVTGVPARARPNTASMLGARGPGQRRQEPGLGAGLPRDVRDCTLGLRRTKARMAAEAGGRGGDRVFRLTEPDAGSDPASMRTWARRDGADWVLHGQKMWITSGSIADVAIVWARADDGIRGFIVPRGTKGFSAQDIHHKLSLRASVTSELLLDEVRLPASAALPDADSLKSPAHVPERSSLRNRLGGGGSRSAELSSSNRSWR